VIIDTHLHLIDRSALHYPWLAGVPPLNRDFSYGEYATEAQRVGVERVLHMEVDVDPADIEADPARVERLSRQAGSMLVGAIASCRPEDADFPAYLEFLVYGEGSMAAFLNPMILTRFMGGKDDQENFTMGAVKRLWSGRIGRLAKQLEGRDYVAGAFSAADISVGYALMLGEAMGVGDYPPAVVAYWDRLKARPAYQKAFAAPAA